MWDYSKYLPIFHEHFKSSKLSIRYNLTTENFEVYEKVNNKIKINYQNKDPEKSFLSLNNVVKKWKYPVAVDFTDVSLLIKKLGLSHA